MDILQKPKKKRMSADARRLEIIKAARRAFAKHGFYGTTTKALAREAGVSEALLFKHFSTKDDIYNAMLEDWWPDRGDHPFEFPVPEVHASKQLTFVVAVMAWKVIGAPYRNEDEMVVKTHLMIQSLLSDGRFARLVHENLPKSGCDQIAALIQQSVEDGDANPSPYPCDLALMFAANMQSAIQLFVQHDQPTFGYHQMPLDQLLRHFTWFVLRGMGMHDDVIEQNLLELEEEFK